MIELPESKVLAKEGTTLFKNLIITDVKALKSPHSFCWMNLEPKAMEDALLGKTITSLKSYSHYLRFMLSDGSELAIGEDVNPEYKSLHQESLKHQLMIQFNNEMILEFKIKLYGFILYGFEDDLKKTMPYYQRAIEAIDPLSNDFTFDYFVKTTGLNQQKGTVKQVLATGQTIPGLGNGILQDILFDAKLLPKRKINTLSEEDKQRLYHSLVAVIDKMTTFGGRDHVLHFTGDPGGYEVLMKNTRERCPICDEPLVKEAYLGGKVIYCKHCQK
ncbi:MAG: endonuclease VIII [Acholeplasma sp.]|nr:MAG: endonuclease VIII [Acholeplasma sp.]